MLRLWLQHWLARMGERFQPTVRVTSWDDPEPRAYTFSARYGR